MLAEIARRNPEAFSTPVGTPITAHYQPPDWPAHPDGRAERVMRFARSLGVELDPWQQRVLRVVFEGCVCGRHEWRYRVRTVDREVGPHGMSWLGDNCLGREHP